MKTAKSGEASREADWLLAMIEFCDRQARLRRESGLEAAKPLEAYWRSQEGKYRRLMAELEKGIGQGDFGGRRDSP